VEEETEEYDCESEMEIDEPRTVILREQSPELVVQNALLLEQLNALNTGMHSMFPCDSTSYR
jgi:hypothetical protein